MYICICNGITDSQIQNAMLTLYNFHKKIDLELLKNYTNSGKKCGCCINDLKDLIEDFHQFKEKDIASVNK